MHRLCLCFAPGLIKTNFARALLENSEILPAVTAKTPLGRIGGPDAVAAAAVFLASRAGSFITGQAIAIDGGHRFFPVAEDTRAKEQFESFGMAETPPCETFPLFRARTT